MPCCGPIPLLRTTTRPYCKSNFHDFATKNYPILPQNENTRADGFLYKSYIFHGPAAPSDVGLVIHVMRTDSCVLPRPDCAARTLYLLCTF